MTEAGKGAKRAETNTGFNRRKLRQQRWKRDGFEQKGTKATKMFMGGAGASSFRADMTFHAGRSLHGGGRTDKGKVWGHLVPENLASGSRVGGGA